MKRRRFFQITAAASLLPWRAHAETRWQGQALGADATVVLTGDAVAAEAVLARLPGLLAAIEAEFSLYDPASALSRLNAAGRLDDPSDAFRAVCAQCDWLHDVTGGVFDPTVQPLWRALADAGDVAAARAAIGWGRVRRGAGIVLDPGQALTFNGVAQGFATDAVRALLAGAGFDHALVNMGEYAALGGPWRVGVEDPVAGMLAERMLTGGAIATSSPNALLIGGVAHILHPLGLAPLWSTVSVEADSAALADGLSTALVFLPRDAVAGLRDRSPGVGRISLVDGAGNLATV